MGLSLTLRLVFATDLSRHDDTGCYACTVHLAQTSLPNVIDRSAASLEATLVMNSNHIVSCWTRSLPLVGREPLERPIANSATPTPKHYVKGSARTKRI